MPPQATVMCLSGSTVMPLYQPNFSAKAWRSDGAPQVMAYWLKPLSRAALAASISSLGGSKSGKPLGQINAVVQVIHAGHLSNYRLGKQPHSVRGTGWWATN